MKHTEHLEELAAINAINAMNGEGGWASWGSPVGLVLFFNGLALCAILVRYAFLMK